MMDLLHRRPLICFCSLLLLGCTTTLSHVQRHIRHGARQRVDSPGKTTDNNREDELSNSKNDVESSADERLLLSCVKTTVDFSVSAQGTPLGGGLYVEDQWADYGFILSSTGGYGTRPRLFDTSDVGADPDLGSPNEFCYPSGPGIGQGGASGQIGVNCEYLGNVLIIQDDGPSDAHPNDNEDGGTITFDFPDRTDYVFALGLLDIDFATSITVMYDTGHGMEVSIIDVPILGDNSLQTVRINRANVIQIRVNLTRSGAVTFLSFCRSPSTPPPTPISTKSQVAPKSPPLTADACSLAKVDFSTSANGEVLLGGRYVGNEWADFGLSLTASGGYGYVPRLFDTSNAGTMLFDDPDLGSPNEKCATPGPGKGAGGEPNSIGANCKPLGNVLIIQENNSDKTNPDDNFDGGSITFDFSTKTFVQEIGLLDVDYKTTIAVMYDTGEGLLMMTIGVPIMGDNSVQRVSINQENVIQLRLLASRSAAVTFISFCHGGTPPTSHPFPTSTPGVNNAADTPKNVPTTLLTPAPSTAPTPPPTQAPTPWPMQAPIPAPMTVSRLAPAKAVEPNPADRTGMASQFKITLELDLSSGGVDKYLISAQRKWESVVVGDLPDVPAKNVAQFDTQFTCHGQFPKEGIDDMYVCGQEKYIDGVGKVLGRAGPTFLRAGSLLPVAGIMIFDSSDVIQLGNRIEDVILHELGHVLGIGSLWNRTGTVVNGVYEGSNGMRVWQEDWRCDGTPPLDGMHFQSSCFRNELMTGSFNRRFQTSPLSMMSIASLEDVGYEVDYTKAEDFTPSQSCCNPGARKLDSLPEPSPHYISAEGLEAALTYGREQLMLAHHTAPQGEDSGDVIYVGDTYLHVIFEENDQIYLVPVIAP